MIVKHTPDGWRLIEQSQHGRLAAQIGEKLDMASVPFPEPTLVAIAQHDDHKIAMRNGQKQYVTAMGTPKDFTFVAMDDETRCVEVKRRIAASRRQHPWIGLLAGRHAEHLYLGQPVCDQLRKLVDHERANRTAVLDSLSMTADDLEKSYQWMRFCDRFSLILCQDQVPEMNRSVEITTSSDGTRFDLTKSEDDRLCVKPWPFVEPQFEVSVQSKLVNQICFTDDADLANALAASPENRLRFRIQRQIKS